MSGDRIEIAFENVSPAEANRYAQELETALRTAVPGISVSKIKRDPSTQDIGTIVGVIVTSGAALAIANGIADWLRKRREASISIGRNGNIVARGLTPDHVVKLAEILAKK